MKASFIAILSAVILCAIDVSAAKGATNEQVKWSFTTNLVFETLPAHTLVVGPVADDFSKELQQNIGVALPEGMIKKNWACVREALTSDGGFTCSNGEVSLTSRVSCASSNSERNVMFIKYNDAMLAFVSECQR